MFTLKIRGESREQGNEKYDSKERDYIVKGKGDFVGWERERLDNKYVQSYM